MRGAGTGAILPMCWHCPHSTLLCCPDLVLRGHFRPLLPVLATLVVLVLLVLLVIPEPWLPCESGAGAGEVPFIFVILLILEGKCD